MPAIPEDPELAAFRQLVDALRPFISSIVVIGGWAHRLYRLHPGAASLSYDPLFTIDTDVVIDPEQEIASDAILHRLEEHGFAPEFLGDDHPPITHFQLAGASGFYAEFLTPSDDYRRRRSRRRGDTETIGGVTAQRLPDLDLLLARPWEVTIGSIGSDQSLRVPNPVTYIAQKLLIADRRRSDDRAKDLLYIHDTIELFGERLEDCSNLWQSLSTELEQSVVSAVESAVRRDFAVVDDHMRRAARIDQRRNLAPDGIQALCELGLSRIFSKPR